MEPEIQARLDSSMLFVGLYITITSAFCTITMLVDIVNGFHLKKLWFPCNYFSLSALWLALLTAATKLPLDLNTDMFQSDADGLAQYLGMLFMLSTLTNLIPSVGRLSDGQILSNVAALAILVITVAGNVAILMFQWSHILGGLLTVPYMIPNTFMVVSLMMVASLAVAAPGIKSSLESKHWAKLKIISREEHVWERRDTVRIEDLKKYMTKYLVMEETGSLQFVMGRSVVCSITASTLFSTLIYVLTYLIKYPPKYMRGKSPYGNYTKWIFIIQSIGVVVGSIAPICRLFLVVSLKCSTTNLFKTDFRIEEHWILFLVRLRSGLRASQIPGNALRRYFRKLKWFIISLSIVLQFSTILLSKLLLLIFVLLMAPIVLSIEKFVKRESEDDEETQSLNTYILRLDGEEELPRYVLRNVRRLADQLIEEGRTMQPNNLLDLLQRSTTFNGVGQFNSAQIPSLRSGQEPFNCWTLSIVTLTSIAVAIPNIEEHRIQQLLHRVLEGFILAKIVEETLISSKEVANAREAANICWAELVDYRIWLDIKLKDHYIISSSQMVGMLSSRCRRSLVESMNEVVDQMAMEDATNWPPKVVAANSMYRICQTLLLPCNEHLTGEVLFEHLCTTVADILAACLTNLPHVITKKCKNNTIEKREESVRETFLLLGKTEQILQILQQREWPLLSHDRAAHIDEWRAIYGQNV